MRQTVLLALCLCLLAWRIWPCCRLFVPLPPSVPCVFVPSVVCCTFCAGCFQALYKPVRRRPGVEYVLPMVYVSRWLCIVEIKGLWMAMTMIDPGDLIVCPVGQSQFL